MVTAKVVAPWELAILLQLCGNFGQAGVAYRWTPPARQKAVAAVAR
jgi:hypothetical protein